MVEIDLTKRNLSTTENPMNCSGMKESPFLGGLFVWLVGLFLIALKLLEKYFTQNKTKQNKET